MTAKYTDHYSQVIGLLTEHFGNKDLTGIEIGAGPGTLTVALMTKAPTVKKLYSIEPFLVNKLSDQTDHFPQKVLDGNRANFFRTTMSYLIENRLIFLQSFSDDAVKYVPKEVDFVWVDGDHTESQVFRDIENYLPLVKKGGIFGGHDYHILDRLLSEYFGDKIINTGADLTWWVHV